MNITLTPERQAALERAAAEKSTPESPFSAADLAAFLLNSACDSYAANQLDADLKTMAADTELMSLGLRTIAANPSKRAAVLAAANAELEK